MRDRLPIWRIDCHIWRKVIQSTYLDNGLGLAIEIYIYCTLIYASDK